jgi:putative membrane protein
MFGNFGPMHMWGTYGDGVGWGAVGLLGGVVMILWWVLVAVAIVVFIRWLMRQGQGGHGGHGDHQKSPMEILKERYAKGEIDKAEFEEKKKDLA